MVAASLKTPLLNALREYTGEALNGYSYLTSSEDQQIFTVISIGQVRGERIINTGLVVRLTDDTIIIEEDINDKPLVDALLQAGIPREQIILAYVGEIMPETV